jgi:hypothetical protein
MAHLDCATAVGDGEKPGLASWKDALKIAQRFNAGNLMANND